LCCSDFFAVVIADFVVGVDHVDDVVIVVNFVVFVDVDV